MLEGRLPAKPEEKKERKKASSMATTACKPQKWSRLRKAGTFLGHSGLVAEACRAENKGAKERSLEEISGCNPAVVRSMSALRCQLW
jgi:hypothetical protein